MSLSFTDRRNGSMVENSNTLFECETICGQFIAMIGLDDDDDDEWDATDRRSLPPTERD